MAIVCLPPDLLKNSLFCIYFRWGEGNPTSVWGPRQSFASFFFPLPMSGNPRSLKCEHLRDPHSLLTVTFWLLDNVSSTGGSIIPPSSSPWAITWHWSYFRNKHNFCWNHGQTRIFIWFKLIYMQELLQCYIRGPAVGAF